MTKPLYYRLPTTLALLALIISCQSSLEAATTLVNHVDLWKYRKGTNAPQANWKVAVDAALDGTWLSGNGGFGFGTTPSETNQCNVLLQDMRGTAATNYTTVYMRRTFTVTNALDPSLRLKLRMDWDDGYIAWLDGIHLTNNASPGAPNEPAYNAVASNGGSGGHESSGGQSPSPAVTNDLGAVGNRLAAGTHVLALIGLNVSQTSGDFVQVANLFVEPAAEPAQITNGIGGTLEVDTTWFATNSVYTVTNNLTVASNVTLTIEAGVTVRLRKDCTIAVNGRLLADGTETQPIAFTRHPGDLNWERILLAQAGDSRFRNCVFEYANCAGDHKTYYATNCAYPMKVGPRDYIEAVVALGCHVDFENCTFRNLFTANGALPEGDAIGIFSDDLTRPGPASANIRGCQFLYIGQAVHTRYAYVLVENCYFIGKTGDNDDVDLYGESSLYGLPSPVVRSNVFDIPCYDDRINPTRCSAIIHDNLIRGDPNRGDHAIVLRDTCNPIVYNNVILDSPAGGISIQNGCDALIANNTFYGIDSAIKLFDHQARITYPYCLSTMSGRATVINCIIWNGSRAIDVSGSAGAPFQKFQVAVSYSNLEGGTNSLYTGSNTKYDVVWGPGIINVDPRFVNAGTGDTHLRTNSLCIDAGSTNLGIFVTTNTYFVGTTRTLYTVTNDLGILVTNDAQGLRRPLDGNGDGVARFDIGAYETLLASADSNQDGIPDGWSQRYSLDPIASAVATEDSDQDGQDNWHEYAADTDPTDPVSFFWIDANPRDLPIEVSFLASSNRLYSLLYVTNLLQSPPVWMEIPGNSGIIGTGSLMSLQDTNAAPLRFYRVGVRIP